MLCPGYTATPLTFGGADTDSACDPVLPLLVAVIDADPAATAVTNPEVDTVATAVLELDHVLLAPEIGTPLPSRATAVAWVVCPTWRLDAASVTATDATVGDDAVE